MLNATHYRDDQGRAVISKSKAHAIIVFLSVILSVGLYNFIVVRHAFRRRTIAHASPLTAKIFALYMLRAFKHAQAMIINWGQSYLFKAWASVS